MERNKKALAMAKGLKTERALPVFILGVGAQKAGTTWLHRYLSSYDTVNMGCMKEYHIWDAKLRPERFPNWILTSSQKPETLENGFRRLLQQTDGAYEAYFSGLISGPVRITGDITPSYTGLLAEDFSFIRDKLENVGFRVKVVFLMRDPVARCWSAQRMHFRNLGMADEAPSVDCILDAFEKNYHAQPAVIRTRYDKTCEALEKAFPTADIHYAFFENLFSRKEVASLSGFMGLQPKDDFVDKVFNETRWIELPLKLQQACFEFYQQTYEYCWRHFPVTKELWMQPTVS